ncbi:MAG: poly(R)-hydroxyalkanoic acid synthase subunit PhaE [Tissierellia bacterium]|nr:poly(R)-hydroxyalkanoic acid synthase subunit PhaE [Tissierellia bacterium]
MENNNFNMFNQYAEAQKNMMDMWNQMVSGFDFQGSNMTNPLDFFKSMMDSVTHSYANYTGSPVQIFEKMGQGTEAYYNLYQLWKDIYEKNIEPTEENIKKLTEDWVQKTADFQSQYLLPYLPTEVQNAIRQTTSVGESYKDLGKTFFGPWQDSLKELSDAMAKGLFKDPEGFLEFFDEWKENYEETFSKALNMPMMGISREYSQRQLQAVDRYIRLMTYMTEVTAKISKLNNENTKDVILKSFEDLKDGKQPKTFEEFYNFWKKSLGDSFDELFYSDEFSKLLGALVDALMDYKITMNKVMEQYFRGLPFPLKSDMDSLYKTIYELKKEVRSLKKQVANLEGKKEEKPSKKATSK